MSLSLQKQKFLYEKNTAYLEKHSSTHLKKEILDYHRLLQIQDPEGTSTAICFWYWN